MAKNGVKKVVSLKALTSIIVNLKNQKKKIVLCHGVFDLIHPGHVRYFSSAKKLGDVLVVTLTADLFVNKGPGRPYFNQNLRSEVLAALSYVDYVAIVNDESAIPAIDAVKPDIYVKGPDYKNRKPSFSHRKLSLEEASVVKYGGKIVFTDDIIFSSSHLINHYLDSFPEKTKQFLDAFKKKYSESKILEDLGKLKQIKALIIGDSIIDEYHYSNPLGKSSKEPIVVHKYINEESYAGGVLATANNTASLLTNVSLLTVLGKKKSYENFIRKHLKKNIKATFFYRPDSQTIVKRRYIDSFTTQKLFQISYIADEFIDTKLENKIISFLKRNLDKFDMTIVNDFGHGFLTPGIIKIISEKSNYLAINVQANSANFGFNVITKYPKSDYICIDEIELRLASHDRYGNTKKIMKNIYDQLKAKKIIVTKGPFGSYAYSDSEGFIQVPALTQHIVDRVGAGDALFAITAPCIYSKIDLEESTFIGNVAAGLKLQIVANKKPLELADIEKFIIRLFK